MSDISMTAEFNNLSVAVTAMHSKGLLYSFGA
jgi:hypothetical protein